MTVHLGARGDRPALALNLELSHGRPGASARVELHDRPIVTGGRMDGVSRVARVALRGHVDAVAAGRLERALGDLALRGVDVLLLDCAGLRHIDFRRVPGLVATLERFEAHAGGVVLCGLSRYLRDVFRLAGCEPRLRSWTSAADLLESWIAAPEPGRERAS